MTNGTWTAVTQKNENSHGPGKNSVSHANGQRGERGGVKVKGGCRDMTVCGECFAKSHGVWSTKEWVLEGVCFLVLGGSSLVCWVSDFIAGT